MINMKRSPAPATVRRSFPLRTVFALLLTAATLCGCVRYDMTLTDGGKMTNIRKPKYYPQNGYYICTLASGKTITIPASHVVSVVPHGDTSGFSAR